MPRLSASWGSSPRLRGTRAVLAYPPHPQDHPRACGEHVEDDTAAGGSLGSSPRLRGTQQPLRQTTTTRGIIPALAGNTQYFLSRIAAARDHPRACGEHSAISPCAARTLGSSPRLRGTHTRCAILVTIGGIIPALAGNTGLSREEKDYSWDHPRACGEHEHLMSIKDSGGGSSPRLRGTQKIGRMESGKHGIIPALAGNTAWTRP